MLAAIDAAKETVNLESYFWSGEIAGRFRDALTAAARRKVQVRPIRRRRVPVRDVLRLAGVA